MFLISIISAFQVSITIPYIIYILILWYKIYTNLIIMYHEFLLIIIIIKAFIMLSVYYENS